MINITKPLNWKTKTETVYHVLREAIISGELKPGERLILSKISQEMGVSVIPVREATKQLEAEGLLEMLAHSEVTVTQLSEKDFHDLSVIRVLLEGYAAYLSAQRLDRTVLEKLHNLIRDMEQCIKKEDFKSYGKLNSLFHECLYSICGNEHLIKLVKSLTERTDRARAIFVYDKQRVKDSLEEHKQIVEALEQGDPVKAKDIIAEQTRISFERFLQYAKHSVKNEDISTN